GVCAHPMSASADALRSPLHPDFTGRVLEREVGIAEPVLAAGVAEALAADVAEPVTVQRPTRPGHPVWPQLPAPVTAPTPPVHPGDAVTSATYPERIADPGGPGCGWAFTGSSAPLFDSVLAEQAADVAHTEALDELTSDAQRWAE